MLKRILVLITCFVLLLIAGCGDDKSNKQTATNSTENQSSEKIIIAMDDDYAPYTYKDGDKPKGLQYEIVLAAMQKAGLDESKVEYQAIPSTRAIDLVKQGKMDGLIGKSKSGNAADDIYTFSAKPSAISDVCLYVLPNSKVKSTGAKESLQNYTIGVQRSYNYRVDGNAIKEAGIGKGIDDESETIESLIVKLETGRIDVAVMSEISYIWKMKKTGKPANLVKLAFTPVAPDQVYLVFGANSKKATKETMEKFNKAYDEIAKDGTVQKIMDKYTKI